MAADIGSYMTNMVILTLGEKNEDFIQLHEDKLIKHVSDVINQGLEDNECVGQPKGHRQVLIMPCRCVKGCPLLIPLPDKDQMAKHSSGQAWRIQ